MHTITIDIDESDYPHGLKFPIRIDGWKFLSEDVKKREQELQKFAELSKSYRPKFRKKLKCLPNLP